jgi:hypothetical protein
MKSAKRRKKNPYNIPPDPPVKYDAVLHQISIRLGIRAGYPAICQKLQQMLIDEQAFSEVEIIGDEILCELYPGMNHAMTMGKAIKVHKRWRKATPVDISAAHLMKGGRRSSRWQYVKVRSAGAAT